MWNWNKWWVFFANGIQLSPPGFFGFAKTPGRDGITGPGCDGIRWNPSDTGFLDFMYGNKSVDTGSVIEHVGKSIYFWDFIFLSNDIKR